MSTNNTQLPVEVVEEIKKNVAAKTNAVDERLKGSSKDYGRRMGYLDGYEAGGIALATEYATKIHQVQQENKELKEKLKQWELDAYEAQGQFESQEMAAIRQSEAFTRLGERYDKACRALHRMTLSMQVHPDNQPNSEFADMVDSANVVLALWEDKEVKGGLPVFSDSKAATAVWVKASEFKYEVQVAYHAKDNDSKGAGFFNKTGCFLWGDGSITHPRDQDDLLILDEAGQSKESIAAHPIELYQRHQESKEGNKEREVSMLKWIITEKWKPATSGGWVKHNNEPPYVLTNKQLWNEWNNRNRKEGEKEVKP